MSLRLLRPRQMERTTIFLFVGMTFVWVVGLFGTQPVFRTGIDVVNFGVTVLDENNNLVPSLKADDFKVYEDDVLQLISYFSEGLRGDEAEIPLHLGLLFDTSISMEQDAWFAKTAAIKFLNSLTQANDITLVEFDDEVKVGRYEPVDFPRLVERIRNQETDGLTSLYDALGVYLDGAFSQDGRKVLLLYTDGEDTRSRMKLSEAVDLVKASDVTVYAIGFQKHLRASDRMIQRMRLRRIIEETGGVCFFPYSIEELDEIYDQIEREITGSYSIGYASTDEQTDGTWRKVEIRLNEERLELNDLKIRARKGYFAPYREPTH